MFRVLHDLNVADKHSDLIAVAVVPRSFTLELDPRLGDQVSNLDQREISALAKEVRHKGTFTIAISFVGVEAIAGQSITQVLYHLVEHVSRAVDCIASASESNYPPTVPPAPQHPPADPPRRGPP